MAFTLEQKSFMVETYFRNGRKIDGVWVYSLDHCLQDFQEEYPGVAFAPKNFKEAVTRYVANFRQAGNVTKTATGRPTKRTEENVQLVRNIMENDPHTSVRRVAQQTNLSLGTCHTILRKDAHLYPYRVTVVQELLQHDIPDRLLFCRWFIDHLQDNDEVFNRTFLRTKHGSKDQAM